MTINIASLAPAADKDARIGPIAPKIRLSEPSSKPDLMKTHFPISKTL
jgi:hypothetical protein